MNDYWWRRFDGCGWHCVQNSVVGGKGSWIGLTDVPAAPVFCKSIGYDVLVRTGDKHSFNDGSSSP